MSNKVLVLGVSADRLVAIGRSVRGQTSCIPLDGSNMVGRQDPPKNWFDTGEYVLLIVDLEFLGGSAMQLMMIEDHCAAIGLPVLILTTEEDPPYVLFGEGGPYRGDSVAHNPPWRIVCRPADRDQALQNFTAWKASQA